MYSLCIMASKTISLSTAAYDRLRAHRRGNGDSFSRVIMRANWAEETVTAGQLLAQADGLPEFCEDESLDRIIDFKKTAQVPADKWNAH